jgi:ABC-2 type transport system ATP-binding protein
MSGSQTSLEAQLPPPTTAHAHAAPDSFGATDLTVRYGRHTALQGVSVAVAPGEVTVVVGGDGSGKSTLLRALAGLVAPAGGRVARPSRAELGYVAGGGGVYADLTVAESLDFVSRAYAVPAEQAANRRRTLLRRTGLAGFEDRLAGRLSGGMRQKLAVVLALLHDPRLLVLDEPTTGVDPVSRAELWRMFSAAAAAGAAVVLATAYIDEAERAAQICVLDHGRRLLGGAPGDIIATVDGAIWTFPVAGARAPLASAWRRGAQWRLWSQNGPPDDLNASAAAPELADAVIAAALAAGGKQPATQLGAPGEAAQGGQVVSSAPYVPGAGPRAPDGESGRHEHPEGPLAAVPLAEPAGALVSGRDLVRRFGSFCAVGGIDIDVRPGEIVGLLGANGAGKTTLIRMLLGLLPPTLGRILLFGLPPSRETRRRTGYVPQGLGLWEDLTVDENLLFAAGPFRSEPPRIDDVTLADARRVLVRDLPLGLRRRLAFVAALAHRPELLVLDEPTSGVDQLARAHLWDTIHGSAESGAGVLVTTHYMDEAEQCDRLIIMAEGRVVATGSATELTGGRTAAEVLAEDWTAAFGALEEAGLPVALMGRRLRVPGCDPAEIRAALEHRHVSGDVRSVPASLDEVFLTLAGRPGGTAAVPAPSGDRQSACPPGTET